MIKYSKYYPTNGKLYQVFIIFRLLLDSLNILGMVTSSLRNGHNYTES